jgi:ribosomal-protein-alanine N-acetyltransferase
MKALIRLGSLLDAEAVAQLQGEVFLDSWSVADVKAQISLPNAVLVSAYHEGAAPDLCGYALGQVAVDEVELRSIGVRRGAQNHGLGRALLRAWEERAMALGARRAVLEVAEDNAPARALYRVTGYQEVGRRRSYYRTGRSTAVDALVLQRLLVD